MCSDPLESSAVVDEISVVDPAEFSPGIEPNDVPAGIGELRLVTACCAMAGDATAANAAKTINLRITVRLG